MLLSYVLALASAPQDLDATVVERLDGYFAPLVELDLFSGVALVARGDDVVAQAYGDAHLADGVPNTIDTRFKLMSTSKPFTSLAVMTLVEEGRVRLADPVSRHLPGWPAAWEAITVRDLMAHTTGLPNLESVLFPLERDPGRQVAWEVLAPAIADAQAGTEPGVRFAYSNFHFVVLGCLLEELLEKPYPDVIRERVLDPAGMTATGFDDGGRPEGLALGYFWGPDGDPDLSVQDMSGIQAAGGLWSSARDLARLHRALASHAIVGAEAWAAMTTPVAGHVSSGWFLNPVAGHECIGHSGGSNGYVADFLHFPVDDACVVVLSNYAFAPITRISHDVAGILHGREVTSLVRPSTEELSGHAGVYRPGAGDTTLVVRHVGKTLSACSVGPGQRMFSQPLLPTGPGLFQTRHGTPVRFEEEGCVRYGADELSRVAVDDATWREGTGGWSFEGAPAFLTRVRDHFELRSAGGTHIDHLVVPLDSREALVLSHGGNGSRLVLAPETDEEPGRIEWERWGSVRVAQRSESAGEELTVAATCTWCDAEVLEGAPLFTCNNGCFYCQRCNDMNGGVCPKGSGPLRPVD